MPNYRKLAVGIAAGAAGTAAALQPEEASGFPMKPVRKGLVKVGKNLWRSSSAERLKGFETMQGKVIDDVLQSMGDWRLIKYTDGTEQKVTKDYITSLCRQCGTKQYIERFRDKVGPSKTEQALKSLEYHEARAPAVGSRQMTRRLHKEHLSRLKEFSDEALQAADTVFVERKGKYFQMPKDYAEHLEGLGILKIRRGHRERSLYKDLGLTSKSRPFRERVQSAYNTVRQRLGHSNVPIADVRDELGVSQSALEAFLRQEARQGRVNLAVGDWSLSDQHVRSGAIKSHLEGSSPWTLMKYLGE